MMLHDAAHLGLTMNPTFNSEFSACYFYCQKKKRQWKSVLLNLLIQYILQVYFLSTDLLIYLEISYFLKA